MGPVAIGGVGGSGTRVVAEILLELGFNLGNDLTRELDDRWFNLLFYRPGWLSVVDDDLTAAATPGLALMRKRASGARGLTSAEWSFLGRAGRDVISGGYFGRHAGRAGRMAAPWVGRRLVRFARSASRPSPGDAGWGWKEPITHLLAPAILDTWPTARYIHVIRHGLDMAFSTNLRQVRRFGSLVGLDMPVGRPAPTDALRYWIRANGRVLDVVRPSEPERTHLVVFEDLCRSPAWEIGRLLDFLEITVDDRRAEALRAIPRTPSSTGRFRSEDLEIFDRDDLEAVERLGFRI